VQAERQSEMDAAAAAELREADEKDAARQLHEKRTGRHPHVMDVHR
jgi:hypothetical protein